MQVKGLLQVQAELSVPKTRDNKFGGYKYRSCEDIMAAATPLLNKYGLQLTVSDEISEISGRIYVKSIATVVDTDGNSLSVTGLAREPETRKGMDEAQVTGATSSYARKYALNGLFLIDDEKDADVTNTHGKQPKEDKPAQTNGTKWYNDFDKQVEGMKAAIAKGERTPEAIIANIEGKGLTISKDIKAKIMALGVAA